MKNNAWKLWYSDSWTGKDHVYREGSEADMRRALQSASNSGEDVWLVDPDGNKHHPRNNDQKK